MTDVELWLLYRKTLKHLTVCKKRALGRLRITSTKYVYRSYIYLIYMYKQDLVLNNLQGLKCHKIKPNQTILWFCVLRTREVVSHYHYYDYPSYKLDWKLPYSFRKILCNYALFYSLLCKYMNKQNQMIIISLLVSFSPESERQVFSRVSKTLLSIQADLTKLWSRCFRFVL